MVYMILGTGFEPMEAIAPCDILRRGGVEVQLVGIGGTLIEAGHGVRVQADCRVEDLKLASTDMVILPGGIPGTPNLAENPPRPRGGRGRRRRPSGPAGAEGEGRRGAGRGRHRLPRIREEHMAEQNPNARPDEQTPEQDALEKSLEELSLDELLASV